MTERHESYCARHNEPAYPNGPCDCRFKEQNEELTIIVRKGTTGLFYATSPNEPGLLVAAETQLLAIEKIAPALKEIRSFDKAVEAIRMSDQ